MYRQHTEQGINSQNIDLIILGYSSHKETWELYTCIKDQNEAVVAYD